MTEPGGRPPAPWARLAAAVAALAAGAGALTVAVDLLRGALA